MFLITIRVTNWTTLTTTTVTTGIVKTESLQFGDQGRSKANESLPERYPIITVERPQASMELWARPHLLTKLNYNRA
jgi:hypothetical protein